MLLASSLLLCRVIILTGNGVPLVLVTRAHADCGCAPRKALETGKVSEIGDHSLERVRASQFLRGHGNLVFRKSLDH